ncbi:MAG: ECF transporter S component [Lachnospiraceae bacterium]|jgi:uncharacterized membrane protein|nr:ECF transporter S component [Lachnospiraceae bacterium]MCI1726531.1 ECF transporter S component [Lachnospiraceae bacterium]
MKNKTVTLTETAVLIAIILLMAFTSIGYLRIGPLSLSLITIPVAVGAVIISPAAGALLGLVFGITSFIQCFTGDPFGAALLTINPFLTFLVCIPTRTLAGFLSGLLFRGIRKKLHAPAYYIGSFAMAFLNTAFFMTVLVLCFWNAPVVQTWSQSLGVLNPLVFILASVSVNAVIEWAATAVIGGSVGLALSKAFGRRETLK